MGLDMFLYREVYVGAEYSHRGVTGTIDVSYTAPNGNIVKIDAGIKNLASLKYRAAYWRKANQIHNWFVQNVQGGVDDCKSYYVSADRLQVLVALCKEVMAILDKCPLDITKTYILDGLTDDEREVLSKLKPSQGFFFGSYDIDSYYYSDLLETVEQLQDLSEDDDYEYRASW